MFCRPAAGLYKTKGGVGQWRENPNRIHPEAWAPAALQAQFAVLGLQQLNYFHCDCLCSESALTCDFSFTNLNFKEVNLYQAVEVYPREHKSKNPASEQKRSSRLNKKQRPICLVDIRKKIKLIKMCPVRFTVTIQMIHLKAYKTSNVSKKCMENNWRLSSTEAKKSTKFLHEGYFLHYKYSLCRGGIERFLFTLTNSSENTHSKFRIHLIPET